MALIIGFISGIIYFFVNKRLLALEIDDPVDAIPIHFGIGLWGTIFTGLFHKEYGLFIKGTGHLFGI